MKRKRRKPEVTATPEIRFPDNGCQTYYKAYAVLHKAGAGNLYIMRELTIQDGRIIEQVDDVEDLRHIKMGKIENAMIFCDELVAPKP